MFLDSGSLTLYLSAHQHDGFERINFFYLKCRRNFLLNGVNRSSITMFPSSFFGTKYTLTV